MQKLLFIFTSAPYGNESFFSGLRLALQLQELKQAEINIFLMSDSVVAGLAKQRPNEGYHIQQMLEILSVQGAIIKLCKTCTDMRGISELTLVDGTQIGTLNELAMWTLEADKVLNF